MSEKGQNFLQRFMQKHTPFRSLADAALLGYTDFDKKGRNEDQTSGLSAGFRRVIAGVGDIATLNRHDFDKKGSNVKIEADKIKEMNKELGLGDPYNREQQNKDMRNMLLTNSLLRRGELAAERNENLNYMKAMYPLLEQAGRNQLERAIEGDQRSPTKISQQRLRAQQGEATLMNAIANQQNSATNAARSGINPRGRAGGA
tara:strand:- start:1365 stop:1970 length:606 start_codon:yes stop_codon:yes gene_type:complete